MAWLSLKKQVLLSNTDFLKNVPELPGVYRMFDADDALIYVGKARNLKKRVSQYFQSKQHDRKTQAMISRIARVEYTVTASEIEALLLEANLIGHHLPKYNILLRDDKSYPYLYISTNHDFPRLDHVRGKKYKHGRYFGPYPTGMAAKSTLNLLQKCFMVRQCKDSYFKHRSRPCLQYQIKRCHAPCVGYISKDDYAKEVSRVSAFLEGKTDTLLKEMIEKMKASANALDYERAASYRDQIEQLKQLQTYQSMRYDGGDADVIVLAQQGLSLYVVILIVRSGQVLGHQPYQMSVAHHVDCEKAYATFISQYYLAQESSALIPANLVLPETLTEKALYEAALSQQAGHKVRVLSHYREPYKSWVKTAKENLDHAMMLDNTKQTKIAKQLEALAQHLNMPERIKRIECFDISHTQGEATKASCVVFDENGANKKAYRQFDIKDVVAGDDYAAMEQVLERRFSRLLKEEKTLPDIALIDGGKGQLQKAVEVFARLNIQGVILIAVAKGVSRKPGLERLLMPGNKVLHIPPFDPALTLIQFIRDESHRFGILAHKRARAKNRNVSVLEQIPGIGVKKRQALLEHFGGLQGLKRASAKDIAKVPGVTLALAEKIRAFLA